MAARALTILILLLCCPAAGAGTGKDYRFTPLPANAQLTQNWVMQTFQDSRGFIWFLTQEGTNRYDGYTVQQYLHRPSIAGSISADTASQIVEDHTGTLWIATLGGGLNRYNPATDGFTAVRHEAGNADSPLTDRIWSMAVDADNNL
ncbi:MAG: hypothetical protein QNI86_13680, partial [Halieaceae bacterium]|nr:hypothetical protein [Halieaceae bacterium]